ncbi:hypothetical protein AMECASPLE_037818 [Ameca splendens]|uniref:Uncharacterized protein n=1 Tax=Ameca splendens TaxID=208324 RepID=A0ABV0Z687_9TELE
MWVKSAIKTMTEQSAQLDPAEALHRVVSDHSQQIESHGANLQSLLEQQQRASEQIDQMATMLQRVLTPMSSAATRGAAEAMAARPLPQVMSLPLILKNFLAS